MVEDRISYLAPTRKTIFFISLTIVLAQLLAMALLKQLQAIRYIPFKPSVNHELLWTLGVGMAVLVVVVKKKMRKVS